MCMHVLRVYVYVFGVTSTTTVTERERCRCIMYYGRMSVEFLDPLGRGGKPSNIPGGICWLNLVVLVERADRQSAAGLGPIFEGGVEARFRPRIQAPASCGMSHSGHWNIQLDG